MQRGDDEVPQSTKYRKVDSESLGPNGIDPGYLTAGKSTGNWRSGVDVRLRKRDAANTLVGIRNVSVDGLYDRASRASQGRVTRRDVILSKLFNVIQQTVLRSRLHILHYQHNSLGRLMFCGGNVFYFSPSSSSSEPRLGTPPQTLTRRASFSPRATTRHRM